MATIRMAGSAIEKSKGFLRVYSMLIMAAQQRGFVTDGDVAHLIDETCDSRQRSRIAGRVLETIDGRERSSGRPMLSAVVLTETRHRPLPSFHRTAKTLGLLPAGLAADQQERFWRNELQRVYEEWSD